MTKNTKFSIKEWQEKHLNESTKIDTKLARAILDVQVDEHIGPYNSEFYLSPYKREAIKAAWGNSGRLPNTVANNNRSMAAIDVLSPLVGGGLTHGPQSFIKNGKTIFTFKPNATWSDIKKGLKIR
jgi:hypothetical protein